MARQLWLLQRVGFLVCFLYLLLLLGAVVAIRTRPRGGPHVCHRSHNNNCCPGWSQQVGSGLCIIPRCRPSCGPGTCIAPNLCLCPNGELRSNCQSNDFHSQDYAVFRQSCNNYGCHQLCHMINGYPHCSCLKGFHLGDDRKLCDDIDECLEPLQPCHHYCINTLGSFICECDKDYFLHTDGKTCVKTKKHGHSSSYCANCQEKQRNQKPIDNKAKQLKKLHTKKHITESPCKNDNCENESHDKTICSGSSCLKNYGKTCPRGLVFEETNLGWQCQDINECDQNPPCHHTCQNTHGSFKCRCYPGYQLHRNSRSCIDINECQTNGSPCQHLCHNTRGSFTCTCRIGFRLKDQTSCSDIDECSETPGLCTNKCLNTIGSYICLCEKGYVLEKGKCHDIDECQEGNGGCFQTCINKEGSFVCACTAGYYLDQDGRSCKDIDECNAYGSHICVHGCHNVEGSFECICPEGYILHNNRQSCIDVDECDSAACQYECENTVGSYHCFCPVGFELDEDGHSCKDVDECSLYLHACKQICKNVPGSYYCICKDSFDNYLPIEECQDLEKPIDSKTYHCPGGNPCICPRGLTLNKKKNSCDDINECLPPRKGGCDQLCINTFGSYFCSCHYGFILQGDQKSCKSNSINKCLPGQNCPLDCPAGFKIQRLGRHCIDIDECALALCSHTCSNTIGSFICTCPEGFFLQANRRNCEKEYKQCDQKCLNGGSCTMIGCLCMAGYTGVNCETSLSLECLSQCANGGTCSDGKCVCLPGLTGSACQIDIDECIEKTESCEFQCQNTFGSFQCICPAGSTLNADGRSCKLIECVPECLNDGICVNGTCVCSSSFSGQACGVDVNECKEQPNICQHICRNTYGSYVCFCSPGSILNADKHSCTDISCRPPCQNSGVCKSHTCECSAGYTGIFCQLDINECLNNHPCSHGCHNTFGSFYCSCPVEMTLDVLGHKCLSTICSPACINGVCINSFCNCMHGFTGLFCENDINECEVTPGICAVYCVNTKGSYYCTCPPNYLLEKDGKSCVWESTTISPSTSSLKKTSLSRTTPALGKNIFENKSSSSSEKQKLLTYMWPGPVESLLLITDSPPTKITTVQSNEISNLIFKEKENSYLKSKEKYSTSSYDDIATRSNSYEENLLIPLLHFNEKTSDRKERKYFSTIKPSVMSSSLITTSTIKMMSSHSKETSTQDIFTTVNELPDESHNLNITILTDLNHPNLIKQHNPNQETQIITNFNNKSDFSNNTEFKKEGSLFFETNNLDLKKGQTELIMENHIDESNKPIYPTISSQIDFTRGVIESADLISHDLKLENFELPLIESPTTLPTTIGLSHEFSEEPSLTNIIVTPISLTVESEKIPTIESKPPATYERTQSNIEYKLHKNVTTSEEDLAKVMISSKPEITENTTKIELIKNETFNIKLTPLISVTDKVITDVLMTRGVTKELSTTASITIEDVTSIIKTSEKISPFNNGLTDEIFSTDEIKGSLISTVSDSPLSSSHVSTQSTKVVNPHTHKTSLLPHTRITEPAKLNQPLITSKSTETIPFQNFTARPVSSIPIDFYPYSVNSLLMSRSTSIPVSTTIKPPRRKYTQTSWISEEKTISSVIKKPKSGNFSILTDCFYQGKKVSTGTRFFRDEYNCSECYCENAELNCKAKSCPPLECDKPVEGPCCDYCPGDCLFNGDIISNGDRFNPNLDPCKNCLCKEGKVSCVDSICSPLECPLDDQITPQGRCCPVCNGLRGDGCHDDGKFYFVNQFWIDHVNQCHSCICKPGGEIDCKPIVCIALCRNPAFIQDHCCPVCLDCTFNDRTVKNEARFPDPSDKCNICICQLGNINCLPRECISECSHPFTPSDECCPVCKDCLFNGQYVKNNTSVIIDGFPCQQCYCQNGEVTCSPTRCPRDCKYQGEMHPSGVVFQPDDDSCSECSCYDGTLTCYIINCNQTCSHGLVIDGFCCQDCSVCDYGGLLYENGSIFHPDVCTSCQCLNGSVTCRNHSCPSLTCNAIIQHPDECCPKCKECEGSSGQHYSHGQFWSTEDPCTHCLCMDGFIDCDTVECPECLVSHLEPGHCCPVCKGCSYNGEFYQEGEVFLPDLDECIQCTCQNNNIECFPTVCEKLNCPPEQRVMEHGQCCPHCIDLPSSCEFNEKNYPNNSLFAGDTCTNCLCTEGILTCEYHMCPVLSCPQHEQIFLPGMCCSYCQGSIQCPEKATFVECNTQCLKTCLSESICSNQKCTPQCICPPGYALHRDNCILISECPGLENFLR